MSGAAGALLAASMLLFAQPHNALAGVGIAVTPTFPAAVQPGMVNLPASLTIGWKNAGPPNNTHADNISNVSLTPACGAVSASSTCQPTLVESTNPITLSATGTGSADCRDLNNNALQVNTFTITPPGTPGGAYSFSPGFTLPINGACTISFTANINGPIANDASAVLSGKQTAALAGALAVDQMLPDQNASSLGSAIISFPEITTLQSAGGKLSDIPFPMTDTGKLVGLVPSTNAMMSFPPSGTITFRLYPPTSNCTGQPFATEVVNLNNPAQCTIASPSQEVNCHTSGSYIANTAGEWHWAAVYSGDDLNPPLTSACVLEPIPVTGAEPQVQTVPDPQFGSKLVTPLGDQAELTKGYFPTGSITFSLYLPSQFVGNTCVGNAIFTNTVPVNGNGVYHTLANAPANLITENGTYHWKARYSGDGNNLAFESPCADEPVVVDAPNILINKSPDFPAVSLGSSITAGEDAVFTITVSSNGVGPANEVVLTDTLPAAFTWSLVSVDGGAPPGPCSISAAPQVLTCNFGQMTTGTSHTVVLKAPTTVAQCTAPGGGAGQTSVLISNPIARATSSNAGTVQNPGTIECKPPRIVITKTPDAPTVSLGSSINAGEDAVFTIRVTSNGAGTAKDVVITDALPAGFTWSLVTINGDPPAGQCSISPAPQVLTCLFGAMPPGLSHIVVLKAPTTLAQCTPPGGGNGQTSVLISNPIAQASASNAATVQDAGAIECKPPRITITKTPDAPVVSLGSSINAGEDAVFTITVASNGAGTANNVVVTDALPAGFTWSLVTIDGNAPAGQCHISAAPQVLTCNFGAMPPGLSHIVVLKAPTTLVQCTPPGGGNGQTSVLISNLIAQASSSNAATVQDPGAIECKPPKIVVEKTPDGGNAAPGLITAGDAAQFTILVTNSGTGVAKNVNLSDQLPSGFSWSLVSVTGTPNNPAANVCGLSAAGLLTCGFGNLNGGETRKVILTATTTYALCTPPGGGQGNLTISNPVAQVTSDNAGPVQDPGTIVCQRPKLVVEKTPDNKIYQPGDTLNFTIKVTNTGEGTARNVRLAPADQLPDPNASLSWSVAAPGVQCTGQQSGAAPSCSLSGAIGSQVLNCNYGDLGKNGSCSVTVTTPTQTTAVDPKDCGTTSPLLLNNTATAIANNAPPASDSASQSCQVAPCDISIDKTCSIEDMAAAGKPPKFDCANPTDGFKMEWDPNSSTDPTRWVVVADPNQIVDLRIWNGAIGSQAPVNTGGGVHMGPAIVCSVDPGEIVSVSGLASGKKGPAKDQYWEVFKHDPACTPNGAFTPLDANRLGNSMFRVNCADDDMKKADDCSTLQGDGHAKKTGQTNFINDWRLAGMSGDKKGDKDVLECTHTMSNVVQQNCEIADLGDSVTYQYKVTNNSSSSVSVNVVDDKKTTANGVVASNVTIPGKNPATPGSNVKSFTWGPVAINATTVNTATVTGNPGSAQCVVTDKVIVTTPCFLGNPATGQLYPYGSLPSRTAVVFNESETLRALEPKVASLGETLRMWYSDEHAMLLGIRSVQTRTKAGTKSQNYAVSPFVAQYPAVGTKLASEFADPLTGATEAQDGVDPAGRPIPPSLFCTDVTTNPTSTAGDWQMGGAAQNPHFISGTWKSATVVVDQTLTPTVRVITTDADPAANNLTLGPNADPVPPNMTHQGYVTEARWNVNIDPALGPVLQCNGTPVQRGRTYRMQFMVHDGDQNKTGGDVGQACLTVSIPQ